MTTSYYADRMNLFSLMQQHPDWSQQELAQAVGRSKSWVQKWQKRFADCSARDQAGLHHVAQGQSQARKTPPARIDERIEALILELRDHPPEGLRRTPGPKTILYYLPRHVSAWDSGRRLPTSTRTIYQILKRNQRIASRVKPPAQEALERQAPLQCWQIDFKEISTVTDDPDWPTGKKQHIAEAFNIVDEGTSILLHSEVRTDFTAETLLVCLAQAIQRLGRPQRITLDRDPRSVGAPLGSDFPSVLLRFGTALGIEMHVCAPRHPQENGFVERYHRSYQQECLTQDRPHTLEEACRVTTSWIDHYNWERPNQALSCGNRPPRSAFPELPQLPRPPEAIQADGWLKSVDGFHVERKVDAHGMVHLDLHSYYVGVHRKGQRVSLQLQAESHEVAIWHEASLLKSVPLKGLLEGNFSFEQFVEQMAHQARAFHRLRSLQEKRNRLH